MADTELGPDETRRPFVAVALGLVLAAQIFLSLFGLSDLWTRGHNGWNGAAYQNAARNSIRWNAPFPVQYATENRPPGPEELYSHAPLGLHVSNVAGVLVFGDREATIRGLAAFWNVAALCMLFAIVRRLWGGWHGVLAAAVYVALPINAIYANMPSHSTGFIFFSLPCLFSYVRRDPNVPWSWFGFVVFLLLFGLCASWDWPAYYLAFAIAAHWVLSLFSPNAGRRDRTQLLLFIGWVCALFLGHFALTQWFVGDVFELIGTFRYRAGVPSRHFRTHLLRVPALMFTWTLLALGLLWLLAWPVRVLRRTASRRDLIPLAYLFAGLVHYFLFRRSAIVHSYWAWPLLPFFAIAVSSTLFAMADQVEQVIHQRLGLRLGEQKARTLSILATASLGVLLLPLLYRDAKLVPRARQVGGSMWFVANVRGRIEPYDSGRAELRFAKQVKAWTDRTTGVLLHPGFRPKRLEPRFDITLDRETKRWASQPEVPDEAHPGVDAWVFLAPVDAFTPEARAQMASQHRYRQIDDYFMLDLRRDQPGIEIWRSVEQPIDAGWWMFHSAFEPPVRLQRQADREEALRALTSS